MVMSHGWSADVFTISCLQSLQAYCVHCGTDDGLLKALIGHTVLRIADTQAIRSIKSNRTTPLNEATLFKLNAGR